MHSPSPLETSDFADIPWYGADRTLPAWRFLPGRTPRPDDRRGKPEIHPAWTPDQWRTLQAYLRGIDLYNRSYFWEAHEAWEPLWRAHPPQADPARFIQGLIGAAAASLKHRVGQLRSARTLFIVAGNRLASFHGIWMGLAVEDFRTGLDRSLTWTESEESSAVRLNVLRIRLTGVA